MQRMQIEPEKRWIGLTLLCSSISNLESGLKGIWAHQERSLAAIIHA